MIAAIEVQSRSIARVPSSLGVDRPMRGGAASFCLHGAVVVLLCQFVWAVRPPVPDTPAVATVVFESPAGTDASAVVTLPAAMIPAAQMAEREAVIVLSPPGSIGPAIPRRPRRVSRRPVPAERPTTPSTERRPTPLAAGAPQPAVPDAKTATAPLGARQTTPDADALAGFTGLVQRAVQAAAAYPPVARRMNQQGRVQVRFDYEDGTVSAIAIAEASASAMLDRAALAAVRNAAYPHAPGSVTHRRLTLVVWVDFSLRPDD